MHQEITFATEPTGNAYRQLLRFALGCCSTLLLVERDGLGLSEHARQLLSRLRPFESRRYPSSRWPGTELLAEEAVIIEFRLCAQVVDALEEAASGLFAWEQPALPEDPCLLRCDGEPWLVTIAHEADAFLRLAPGELRQMAIEAPAARACLP